jgi:hypothetical protein
VLSISLRLLDFIGLAPVFDSATGHRIACDLRWDDLDLPKRTIAVRRLKGSTDSVHYLERDELAGLRRELNGNLGDDD